MSKIWIGCPNSYITKWIISIILFIDLIPIDLNLEINQYGDGSIFIFEINIPEYLIHVSCLFKKIERLDLLLQ